MLKHASAYSAALTTLLTLMAGGCGSVPSTPHGRDFESIPLEPSSPDSSFGVSGTKDSDNDFLSTLWILWPEGTCSGVLIAPQVVLTSAHCFCLPPDFGSTKDARIYDMKDCQKNAPAKVEVFTVYYDSMGKKDIPISGNGSVVTHESFKSEIKNAAIQRHQADLAVIRLKAPLTFELSGTKRSIKPTGDLPDRDVTLNEPLTFDGSQALSRTRNGSRSRKGSLKPGRPSVSPTDIHKKVSSVFFSARNPRRPGRPAGVGRS